MGEPLIFLPHQITLKHYLTGLWRNKILIYIQGWILCEKMTITISMLNGPGVRYALKMLASETSLLYL